MKEYLTYEEWSNISVGTIIKNKHTSKHYLKIKELYDEHIVDFVLDINTGSITDILHACANFHLCHYSRIGNITDIEFIAEQDLT